MLKLAYFVELTWLLVDMFSGYLQNHGIFLPGNQTVSALVRVGVVALFLAILLRHPTPKRQLILALLLICLAWILVHVMSYSLRGEGDVLADVQFHLKLMLPVLLFGVLQVQMERGALDYTRVRRIVLFNAFVLVLNLSLGLFGIGFGNYGESESGELLGSKGFFYAGNEVSATLVAIFALIIFVFRDRLKRHSLLMLGVAGLFFVVSLMSMSKTSLLGFVLVTLFALYNYLSLANKIKFSTMLAVALLATTAYWLPLLQLSIERWEYFWMVSPDLLDFLTSGRTGRIESYVAWLTGGSTTAPWIFGAGQLPPGTILTFENDLLDVTMGSGLLGLLFFGVWSGWAGLGLAAKLRYGRSEGAFAFYMIAMFLVLSIVAGHVLYSATLAPFIALLALTSSRYFPGNAMASSGAARP